MSQTPYLFVPLVSPLYRFVKRWSFRVAYSGNRVQCPLCAGTFRTWLHHDAFGDCPYCRSAARHRFLWLFLAKEWSEGTSKRELLHFAPEFCFKRALRHDNRLARYVTADLGDPQADVKIDITAISFDDASFAAIICSHVLEHVIDDRQAMRELFRVLKPGGCAYIQVPLNRSASSTDEDSSIVDPNERAKRFGQFDHVRVYARDIVHRLGEVGFKVAQIRPRNILNDAEITRYGLWDDVIFKCQRE